MGEIERRSGSGNWMTTYSDLVTLLLVFFVLLYVLTPGIDESTFNDIMAYFQNSSSVVFTKDSASEQKDDGTLRKEWQQVQSFLEEQGYSQEVDIEKTDEGVKVTLNDSLTFESGSAQLLKRSEIVLERIALAIDGEVSEVKTHGHTDNVPISDSSIYRTNWHLGAARAVSVVLFLNREATLASEKFEASSYGEFRPVASNNNSEGRRRNRRVEIYINYEQEKETIQIDASGINPDSLEGIVLHEVMKKRGRYGE
ncbi:OmpA/MotB family protein [Fodinibius salsisoli]|uniref:Flagellar motor protein MotB n=1 Tax=Fodinibius salsisoli TaxID=2820877 RepID=A0ABT3PHI5_9BACT|nr:flagellar motor protein MotB [Fodinibius salsisoli]MCW9705370.1 flagellar motor protein MotB [Fodinibius salsisoli]